MMVRFSVVSAGGVTPLFGPDGPALDEVGFYAWVAQAAPGETLVYHRGFIAVDTIGSGLRLSVERQGVLRRLAGAAMRAAERQLVHLVQARLGPGHFAYIAVARPKPRHAGAALSMRLLESEAA